MRDGARADTCGYRPNLTSKPSYDLLKTFEPPLTYTHHGPVALSLPRPKEREKKMLWLEYKIRDYMTTRKFLYISMKRFSRVHLKS